MDNYIELINEVIQEEMEVIDELIKEDIEPLIKYRQQLEKEVADKYIAEMLELEEEVI